MPSEGLSDNKVKLFAGKEWSRPVELFQVEAATEAFTGILLQSGWEDDLDAVANMEIGYTEALANAVKHGNNNDPAKKVHVKIEATKDRVCVTVRDEGKGFKREEVPDPHSSEDLAKGSGRGVLLMENFFDSVTYNEMGNEVTMVKERKG